MSTRIRLLSLPVLPAIFSALLLGTPLAILAVLLAFPSTDRLEMAGGFHFWIVSGTTLASAAAFVVVMMMTKSLSETRLVFLGLAFLSIAAVFSVHGLGTPGHLHSSFHAEVATSSWMSVTMGALFVAASVVAFRLASRSG